MAAGELLLTLLGGVALLLWGVRMVRTGLTRAFGALYGTSPAAYRLEALARHAWRRIVSTGDSLADIACDTGFADQPHMTRAVVRLTGHTPGEWRKRPAG